LTWEQLHHRGSLGRLRPAHQECESGGHGVHGLPVTESRGCTWSYATDEQPYRLFPLVRVLDFARVFRLGWLDSLDRASASVSRFR